MTDRQKLDLAAATARKELRALALSEDATAEQIAEATATVDNLEARAAALSDEPDLPADPARAEDGEGREIRKLEKRVNLGAALARISGGRLHRGCLCRRCCRPRHHLTLPHVVALPGRTQHPTVHPRPRTGPSSPCIPGCRPGTGQMRRTTSSPRSRFTGGVTRDRTWSCR